MCKESASGVQCPGCRNIITFFDYHVQHCVGARIAELPSKKGKKRGKRK